MANKPTATRRSPSGASSTATARTGAKAPAKPVAVPGGSSSSDDARFDRLVYERVRLGIMSALAVNDRLTVNELKSLFDVSDGNLSAHARKLEEAGYVECTKSFEGRRPKSEYQITSAGRKALNRYLEHIEAVIKATRRQ
jgi:DNA-binding MarR family transcriptional regulator